jgi:S1-C subfamily serine protease
MSKGVEAGTWILVIEASDGGPAEAAGVKPNDVIITLNSQSIREVPQLPKIIRGSVPGRTVRLTVLRGKERVQVPVTLGQPPEAMWALFGWGAARLRGESTGAPPWW